MLDRKTNYYWGTHKNCHGNVKTILREERGLALDQVSVANDKSDISNDVNEVRRFFKHDSVDATVACVPIKHKETVK